MKIANIVLLVICAAVLQGCGTFYYPSRAPIGSGAYLEKDWIDEADEYYYGSGVGYATLAYADIPYYPWWSLDYYYFGPHYYRPHYLGYRSGWYASLGFNFAYSPYYWPYGFYGPVFYLYPYHVWHDPRYRWPGYGLGFNVFWSDVYWHKRFNQQVNNHHHPGRYDYGNSRYGYVGPREDVHLDPRFPAPANSRAPDSDGTGAVSRSISMAPSTGDQDRGMEVRSRRERKIRESHIGPAPVQPASSSKGPSAAISGPPAQSAPVPVPEPVVSAPAMMRQVQPPQARSPGPRPSGPPPASAPVASPPRAVRQVRPTPPPPREARPGAPPSRAAPRAPSRPAPVPRPGPGRADSVPSPDFHPGNTRHK